MAGQPVARGRSLDGQIIPEQARYLYTHSGLDRLEIDEAQAGEIVLLAGLENIAIGETLADPENPVALPIIHVEEPTVRMTFGVNTSPFSGKEGKWGTSRKIRERLFEELCHSIKGGRDRKQGHLSCIRSWELHLAILIETMRREG
jgi:GTP-binding protein